MAIGTGLTGRSEKGKSKPPQKRVPAPKKSPLPKKFPLSEKKFA